jgi:23S rRNA (guanine2535-N1)-methyltransferase
MPYQFARERLNYAAFASGQVLHSLPGRPAFPARLASEIYQRSVALLPASAGPPYVLYDPCCGGAQFLTTLAYLHGETIAALIGSDIDPDAVRLAARNLALVTLPGLDMRSTALAALAAQYGKPAHREALAHTVELRERLVELTQQRTITAGVFQADALNTTSVHAGLAGATVDLVITDVPYGQQTAWTTLGEALTPAQPPVWRLLEALRPVLAAHTVVAIATDKTQRVQHDAYRRRAQWQIGKRRVTIVSLLDRPSSLAR